MTALVSVVFLLGVLLFAYRLMLRPLGSTRGRAAAIRDTDREEARSEAQLRAVGILGVAIKLSIILLDTSGGLFQPLLVFVFLLAVSHILIPKFVEIAVGVAALVVAAIQYVYLFGAPSHGVMLGIWLLFVVGTTGVLGILLGPGPAGWLGGGNRRQLASLFVGLGALVLIGFDFFDPLYRDAWRRIFGSAPSTLGWFLVGLLLAVLVAKAPVFSAVILGAGLILSEVIIRTEYCRLGDAVDASFSYGCGHLGSALVLAGLMVVTRAGVGRVRKPS